MLPPECDTAISYVCVAVCCLYTEGFNRVIDDNPEIQASLTSLSDTLFNS